MVSKELTTKQLIDKLFKRIESGELSPAMRKKYLNAINKYLKVIEKRHPEYKINYEKKYGKRKWH